MKSTQDDPNAVHIYLVKVSPSFAANADFLPEPQRSKARAYSGKRLTEFTVGRLLISHILEPNWRIFERDRKGPVARCDANETECSLSVSHSNNWVGVAVGLPDISKAIGFDIEKIRSNWSRRKAAFFCNQQQIEEGFKLTSTTERDRFFTLLWCQKEAYFKATQNPIIDAGFKQDPRMQSKHIDDQMIMSFFSQPQSEIGIHFCELISGGSAPTFSARIEPERVSPT